MSILTMTIQRHFFSLRPLLSCSLARYWRFNLLFLWNFRPLIRSSNNASHFSLCPTLLSVGSVEGSQKEIVWSLVKDTTTRTRVIFAASTPNLVKPIDATFEFPPFLVAARAFLSF